MGSLMAGWDSPPKSAKFERNQSLTKEEIDAYWNLKKKIQDEHLRALSPRSADVGSPSSVSPPGDRLVMGNMPARTRSLPAVVGEAAAARERVAAGEEEETLKRFMMEKKKEGWWTRSNWAFLNEPPVIERASNSYPAQFHIATNPRISTH
ncbi:unnamed protein product [Linum trigynum]|uniref:Uncharacterized protein n=1 Tax=Linum trigynum TaxID=586398 RepID=A0AAV2EEL9_9ROSI